MTSQKTRQIRRYMTSFGMMRKDAEAFYADMQEKEAARKAAAQSIPTYYSDTLKMNVTIPA